MVNKFEVSVTAIIERDGKFLITKRSKNKKRFPGLWTVPGGHVELKDIVGEPNNDGVVYDVLENAVRREVMEETGLDLEDPIRFVASMALDGNQVLVVSLTAQASPGEVKLDPEEAERYAWVTLEEAKNYKLIDGIYNELARAAYARVEV